MLGLLPRPLLPDLGHERLDLLEKRLGVAGEHRMVDTRKLDMPRARDVLREVTGSPDDIRGISAAVENQSRNPYGRQYVADVDLHVHAVEGIGCTRACTQPQHRRERTLVLLAGARSECRGRAGSSFGCATFAPVPLADLPVPVLGDAGGVVGRPEDARVGADDDQRPNAIGIRRGEEDAHRTALRDTEQRRAIRADRIHHSAGVVHAGLERGSAGHRIGHAGSSLVETDQAREGRQSLIGRGHARDLPCELDVRCHRRDVHEIEGAVASDLVRD